MNQRGFTLLESLLAVALMGIVLAAIVPAFVGYLDTNTLSEERSSAVAVAQQAMEALRQQDPTTLPANGTSPVQLVAVEGREYEVRTRFCVEPALCGIDSRHLIVEVDYGGRTIYTVESVFTRLR